MDILKKEMKEGIDYWWIGVNLERIERENKIMEWEE